MLLELSRPRRLWRGLAIRPFLHLYDTRFEYVYSEPCSYVKLAHASFLLLGKTLELNP